MTRTLPPCPTTVRLSFSMASSVAGLLRGASARRSPILITRSTSPAHPSLSITMIACTGSSARLVWRHSGRFECAAYEAGAGAKARAASTGELFPEDGPVREVHELRWELDAVAVRTRVTKNARIAAHLT